MKKNLTVCTLGFPFGESERSFFSTEFDVLKDRFSLSLLARKTDSPINHPFPDNIPVEQYEYSSLRNAGLIKKLTSFLHVLRPEVLRELFRALKNCNRGTRRQCFFEVLAYSLNAKQATIWLEAMINQEHTDIIYTFWCTEMTLAAVRLKKKYPQLRVITRFHNIDLFNERRTTGWQPFKQRIADGADKLVFVCKSGQDYFMSHWTADAGKSTTALLGSRAMPKVIPHTDSTFVLVSCSLMVPVKRIELIIGALALIPSNVYIEWHHFGDGAERKKLENLAVNLLAPMQNITWTFHGNVPNASLGEEYSTICPHFFITTTLREGLPVSIQEAFAAGIPVIATAVDGIPELVQSGKTGILLAPDASCEEIADAITGFCGLPEEERCRLSNNALTLWKSELDSRENARKFCELLKAL